MESDEGGAVAVGAKKRIEELENVVIALTAELKAVTAETLALKKVLADLEQRLKDRCREHSPMPSPNDVTLENSETLFSNGRTITETESPTFSSSFEDPWRMRHKTRDEVNEATCGTEKSLSVGIVPHAQSSQKDMAILDMSHQQAFRSNVKKVKSLQNQTTRLVALKIMYIGTRYHGFASQGASNKTVEAELFAALERTKLITGDRNKVQYSRCGRTDKGVSATGQLIALQLRSQHKENPKRGGQKMLNHEGEHDVLLDDLASLDSERIDWDRVAAARESRSFEQCVSSVVDADEIDYAGVLNRVLPEDIRVLGWCPVPTGFNARFSCLYREYKYFFINERLDVNAMKLASAKFIGDHDFRNFCKMDAANVHNYKRNVSVFEITPVHESRAGMHVWVIKIRGTAFLWHQVRCMVAVLFMVGQGLEPPRIVDDLLDVESVSKKPQYIMASEMPLVLHSCGFRGLKFHCTARAAALLRTHMKRVVERTLLQLAILQEAMLGLPTADVENIALRPRHTPLLLRATEPSYDERRERQSTTGC